MTTKLQFSLRALLIVVPVLAALLTWSVRRAMSHEHQAVAVIRIGSSAAARLWPWPSSSAPASRENLVLHTSDEIFLAAIHSLRPESREWVECRGEPLNWLRRHLRITFVGKSDLVQIVLQDDSLRRGNLAAEREIVNAVVEALCGFNPNDVSVFRHSTIER